MEIDLDGIMCRKKAYDSIVTVIGRLMECFTMIVIREVHVDEWVC